MWAVGIGERARFLLPPAEEAELLAGRPPNLNGKKLEALVRLDRPDGTNAVYIGEHHVLKVSLTTANPALAHELRVSQDVAEDVGYPEIVDHGDVEGHPWLLQMRVPV